MFLEMSNAKNENSLNDVETAYFVYKWIGQNIEVDCLGNTFGNSSTLPATIYKEGKGGTIGISALFNMICGLLNIESNTIFGLKKILSFYNNSLIQIKEYAWNYISIDNKYYILDVVSSAGECNDNRFYKLQRDKYFGIDPEDSIRVLFPNDKKWQLLSEPITEDKFKSQAYLSEGFFKYFTSITPDIQTIRNKSEIKIKLTVKDPNIKKLDIMVSYDAENELPEFCGTDEVSIVNGTCEYTVDFFYTCYTFIDIADENHNNIGHITFETIIDEYEN